ncbi:MAG: hypothetical protein KJN64_06195 [Ignavibacteria bacterium]|nr:hypothetical protein [Ignavibacteria bacterium]MBT8392507.1 hypothetical protein [Ignavibacteria bacterium]NNJ53913.1 hypothetical protein [Ignavibacteriaceae bacterium]NNL19780.1 hypothetical protein [Ignavibacteriaceae bacterium]
MKNDTFMRIITSFIFGALILGISILFYSCKVEEDVVSSTGGTNVVTVKALISGQVVDKATGFPVDSALVRIFGNKLSGAVLYTASDGQFFIEGEVEMNEVLMVLAYKTNFKLDSTSVSVVDIENVTIPQIQLEEVVTGGGGTTPSGDPVSIFLSAVSSTTIGVKESGSTETTQITFVVQDSAGVPVDIDHSVIVEFSLGAGPGGGEFLSPTSVETNFSGQASVNLTSGIKAGAVQVVARVQLATKTLTSLPVPITIHGGLPDFDHFSIAPALVNFPGYNIFGLENQIVAFVGDKYANPVKPETAVYFTTSGGIIQGSTLTNESGIGGVNLISALPRPNHQTLGEGFATITASTIDENSNTISRETIVLFSGVPQVSINPTTINVPNGGFQTFTYTVNDQNGNPLSNGTSIKVTVEGESVDAQGDLDFTLPDTQSPSWTQFSFFVYDIADTVAVNPATIKIEVNGDNGQAFTTISGYGN